MAPGEVPRAWYRWGMRDSTGLPIRRSVAALLVLVAIGVVSCTNDETSAAAPGSSGPSATTDGGAAQPGTTDPSAPADAGDPGDAGTDGGGTNTPPGVALAFPLDVALLSYGRPLNIDTETDILLSGSLQYKTAYDGDGGLQASGSYFRFTERTHTALAELPPAGIRVWWRHLQDDGDLGSYVCRETNTGNGIVTLKSNAMAGSEPEPDSVWRDQCSWTLWKHPTEDAWYLRIPKGFSADDSGTFVVQSHGTATEGYRIRVDGSIIANAPFFRFKSKL